MTKPFTANEIQKATQGMKNGKSSGIDPQQNSSFALVLRRLQ
jgi:hypothetical protein